MAGCKNDFICTLVSLQEKKIQSKPALRTPHYYGDFALSLGKESPYIFTKVNSLNTDTSLLRGFCFVPGERKPLLFI